MYNNKVKVFAPVNIAWIKYMGKNNGIPTNSSLSLTLATLGTDTEMQLGNASDELIFTWDQSSYVPPIAGQKKVEAFLKNQSLWNDLFNKFGFECHFPQAEILIQTMNNVPAGTGIATSASAYAALTLAWSALLVGDRRHEWIEKYQSGDPELRRAMAVVSSKGSGSSCRSLDGPWVEWNADQGIQVIDGGSTEWVDFIFILESDPKQVPSSEAHERVKTSPFFSGRIERAENRLIELKSILKKTLPSISKIQQIVLDEALDMHQLFHTSIPPFQYMNDLSENMVSVFKSPENQMAAQVPSLNGVVTLDAGANVHLFVPFEEEELWEQWIKVTYPQTKYLKDVTGFGAHYEQ